MNRPLRLARTGIHPVAAAALAFAAAGMLGVLDLPSLPSLPNLSVRLGFDPAPVIGLSLTAAIGLLAWHLATLTVLPRPALASGSMGAALLPAWLMPGVGLAALLPALALSFALTGRGSGQRTAALLVQCGAILALVRNLIGVSSGATDGFLCATMAVACGFAFVCAASRAANDNPLLKRPLNTVWFYESGENVILRRSIRGSGSI